MQRKTRCRKKILLEVVLDFHARNPVVHWQIYVILRVSAAERGASGSWEMVPELKLMFPNPWLSPGKPGAGQRADLAMLSAEPFEPSPGAEIQC